jgi:serpin B
MSQKMKYITWFVLLAFLAGCMPGPSVAVSAQTVRSEKPRTAAPQVTENDQAALSAGNNAFALDLYRALGSEADNLFFSPYSISLALAMTYAGARGETAAQMADTLRFDLPDDRLHPAFNAVDQTLASRKDLPGEGTDGKGFRLNIVNDLWGQKDFTFLPEFLDLLATNYGAGLRLMDFSQQPEESREEINKYIEQQTEKRIIDLIPQGAVTPLTRLVLTNAIYFNAAWLNTFDQRATADAPFTLRDGSQVTVPMMESASYENLRYVSGDGYQAVALLYENTAMHMLIIVPDAGRFDEFEAGFDVDHLDAIINELSFSSVRVKMPKFQVEGSFGLADTLAEMGMPIAFAPDAADFSGMNGERDLFISDVVHKSFVKVDEQGTEAAAATAVIVAQSSAPTELIDLTIDRPFIFLIRDNPTNTTLFLGRLLQPQ